MKEQDYELLSQYLDGELPAAEVQALRERLLCEPHLRANYERLRSINTRLQDAFNTPGIEAVPARVTNLLENAETGGVAAAAPRRAGWSLAVAASLLAATGLLLAPDWRQPVAEDPLLAELLEHTPSRGQGWDALPDGRQVRPLLSFRDKAGAWCREYLLSDAGAAWRGVACRSGGIWSTAVLAPEQLAGPGLAGPGLAGPGLAGPGLAGPGNEYRPAGAANADAISSYISTHAADIPLSLEQEAGLIASQWQ